MGSMSTDPILGSFVWLTSSIAFLTAGTAVVRMLDARVPARRTAGDRRAERVAR